MGDLLPDQGALGVVKNLLDKEPGVDPDEAKAMIDAEVQFQNNVTERWKADMGSDVKLAKLIRPVTLIALMVMFMATMVADSMDNWPFNVKDSYVSLLEILMLTAFGAYLWEDYRKSKKMRTRYRNGKPPYNQGTSWPPGEDMPLTEVMSSDATMVSMPDHNMLLRQQLVSDQEDLGLFNSTFGEFYNTDEESSDLPYPSSWTGRVDVDSNPYILELAGLPALMKGASKHLLKKGVKEAGPKVVKRGGNVQRLTP